VERAQELLPRLLIPADPLQRLAVEVEILRLIGRERDGLLKQGYGALPALRPAQAKQRGAQKAQRMRVIGIARDRRLQMSDPFRILHVSQVAAAEKPVGGRYLGIDRYPPVQ